MLHSSSPWIESSSTLRWVVSSYFATEKWEGLVDKFDEYRLQVKVERKKLLAIREEQTTIEYSTTIHSLQELYFVKTQDTSSIGDVVCQYLFQLEVSSLLHSVHCQCDQGLGTRIACHLSRPSYTSRWRTMLISILLLHFAERVTAIDHVLWYPSQDGGYLRSPPVLYRGYQPSFNLINVIDECLSLSVPIPAWGKNYLSIIAMLF